MGFLNFRRRPRAGATDTDGFTPQPTTTAGTTRTKRRAMEGVGVLILGLRATQLLFAISILGLIAYAENIYGDTFLRAAYVPALVISILTLLYIPITFPQLLSRFSPRGGVHHLLVPGADFFFALLWLCVVVELAAYEDVSSPKDWIGTGFGKRTAVVEEERRQSGSAYGVYTGTLGRLKRAWRCGAIGAAFSGLEFVLFLSTTFLALRPLLKEPFDTSTTTLGTRHSREDGRTDSAGVPISATSVPETRSGSHATQTLPEHDDGFEMRALRENDEGRVPGSGYGDGRIGPMGTGERRAGGNTVSGVKGTNSDGGGGGGWERIPISGIESEGARPSTSRGPGLSSAI